MSGHNEGNNISLDKTSCTYLFALSCKDVKYHDCLCFTSLDMCLLTFVTLLKIRSDFTIIWCRKPGKRKCLWAFFCTSVSESAPRQELKLLFGTTPQTSPPTNHIPFSTNSTLPHPPTPCHLAGIRNQPLSVWWGWFSGLQTHAAAHHTRQSQGPALLFGEREIYQSLPFPVQGLSQIGLMSGRKRKRGRGEGSKWSGVCGEINCSHYRAGVRLLEKEKEDSRSHIGWPLYLPPRVIPVFYPSSHGLVPFYLPRNFISKKEQKKILCFLRKGFCMIKWLIVQLCTVTQYSLFSDYLYVH